jgi:hypothetical protein
MELTARPVVLSLRASVGLWGKWSPLCSNISADLRPPAPAPPAGALGPFLCMLARIPLEARTQAYFEQVVVASHLSIGRVVVVGDPAAIRRVLLENCDNSEKDRGPQSAHASFKNHLIVIGSME